MKVWSTIAAGVVAVAALTLAPTTAHASVDPGITVAASVRAPGVTGLAARLATGAAPAARSLFGAVPSVEMQPMFDVRPAASTGGGALLPSNLWKLYGEGISASALRSPSATSPTIAVVDVGHYASTYQDLVDYRKATGLPACASEAACLTEVNQSGGTSLPGHAKGDSTQTFGSGKSQVTVYGWQIETDLDVQMATATCPSCHILLVDANSAGLSDMLYATNVAAYWANWVSLSFGGPDTASHLTAADEARFDQKLFAAHPDVVFTAATDDDGYEGAQYPAAASNVIAAGGTSTTPCSSGSSCVNGYTSTVWDNSEGGPGSGCAQATAMPQAQQDISGPSGAGACTTTKAEDDLAAVADPDTGMGIVVAGYELYGGGTSAAAPAIAGLYATAHNSTTPYEPYSKSGDFTDVTTGASPNCDGTRICAAATGWDGPTGLGVPKSIAAFQAAATPGSLSGPGNGTSVRTLVHQAVSVTIPVSSTVALGSGTTALTGLSVSPADLPAGLSATVVKSGSKITGIRVSGTPSQVGSGMAYLIATGTTAAGKTLKSDIPIGYQVSPLSLWVKHKPRLKGAKRVGGTVRLVKPQARSGGSTGAIVHPKWKLVWQVGHRKVHHGARWRLPASVAGKRLVVKVTASATGYATRTWRLRLHVG